MSHVLNYNLKTTTETDITVEDRCCCCCGFALAMEQKMPVYEPMLQRLTFVEVIMITPVLMRVPEDPKYEVTPPPHFHWFFSHRMRSSL